ncbi:MAG: hypothetical protein RSC68_29800 [Acinetobacter sp.]
MNFAGGAVTLIFTVERFNSAVHHREAHFFFCPCRQAGGTFLEPDNDALVVDKHNTAT